jgi:hypothetical protein
MTNDEIPRKNQHISGFVGVLVTTRADEWRMERWPHGPTPHFHKCAYLSQSEFSEETFAATIICLGNISGNPVLPGVGGGRALC